MRFHFNLHNDIDTFDEEGVELANEGAARRYAEAEARIMAAESVKQGRLDLTDFIEVTDNAGTQLFRVTFGEAVAITS